MNGTHWRAAILAAAFFGATVALVALRLYDPATSVLFPPCPLYELTGWYCPGCGSLRALHQLLHGNLAAAFAMNPLAVVSLPFLLYGTSSFLLFRLRGRFLPRYFIPASSIWMLGALIVAFGIARNIPVYPLNLLAPGAMLRF